MKTEFSFEMDGLEELEKDLKTAVKKCPEEAKETLKKLGKDFRKSATKRANLVLKPSNRTEEEKKKAIRRKWDDKVLDEDIGMTSLIWNEARHFHLVEDGHNLVKNGKVIGFVPGKHIMKKTREEYKEIVPERFKKMVDDILRGSNL